MTESLADARGLLAGADRVLVLTGAGMSAESGVPTFRGEGGLWRSHRAEDLATPQAFRRDPVLVWTWYAWRRELVGACAPNAGHRALARFASRTGARIVTQNVDGLHERAAREAGGGASSDPLTLHGSLFGDRCSRCGRRSRSEGAVDATSLDTLPRCSEPCGGLLRPDVVWFGESLDGDVLNEAFALARSADVCLVVGTSGLVHPAASLPGLTSGGGGSVIELNIEATPLSSLADIRLRGSAAELLPCLLEPAAGVPGSGGEDRQDTQRGTGNGPRPVSAPESLSDIVDDSSLRPRS